MPREPPPPSITITIEHAPEFFYRSYFLKLHEALMTRIPDAKILQEYGRQSAYEITVNERLIYSKLKRGKFPKQTEIVDYCDQVVRDGREPEEVPHFDYVFCCIL